MLEQNPAKPVDRTQGRTQIMRYAVGKRIQLANRGLELDILFVQRALVSLSLGDVAHGILMQAGQFGGLFFKRRILLSRVGE